MGISSFMLREGSVCEGISSISAKGKPVSGLAHLFLVFLN